MRTKESYVHNLIYLRMACVLIIGPSWSVVDLQGGVNEMIEKDREALRPFPGKYTQVHAHCRRETKGET